MRITNGPAPPRSGRFYRALLRLLPFEFRADFGRDMEEAFSDEREEIGAGRGGVAKFRFWTRTLLDFARTAPREQWDVLRQDLRVGARQFARSPGFTAAAVLTLALGIGGSTGIFSVVYAVVLRPLQLPQSERVVHVGWGTAEDVRGLGSLSFVEYRALREKCRSFELVGAATSDSLSSERGSLFAQLGQDPFSDGRDGPSFRSPMMASASLFRLIGASAVLGRLPDERDEAPGAAPVAVLSHSTWMSLYGGDANVLGRTLVRHLDDGRSKSVTIVGVLAANAFCRLWPRQDAVDPPAVSSLDIDAMRGRDDHGREEWTRYLGVFARLGPGATLTTARAELAALTPDVAPRLAGTRVRARSLLRGNRLRDEVVADVRAPLGAFLCAVVGLLLVACVNVSSLVLARALARGHEFAARLALGARPFRVVRQLLTESGMLALSGGSLGLVFALAGWRAFVAISPSMPRLAESGIGAPALLFALGAVLVAACTAAAVPAFLSSRRSVAHGLRRAGGAAAAATGFSRPLAMLAGAEIALVLVLLAGTGLLANSFVRLVVFDLGFDARSIVMVTINYRLPAQPASSPRRVQPQSVAELSARQREEAAIGEEITRRAAAVPGVAAVGLTGDDPFRLPYRYSDARLAEADPPVSAWRRVASPSAFDALGLHLVGGRWFTRDDGEGKPLVAVVSDAMAKRFWSGRSPIGERFLADRRTLQVVGVVADVRSGGARGQMKLMFWEPTTQTFPDPVMLVVRKRPGAKRVETMVADALAGVGARIEAGRPRPLEAVWSHQLADARFLTLVVSAFGGLALVVALVGVHGVLRFAVVQRTREIGIRRALGATDAALLVLVVGQALRFTLPACGLGLAATWLVSPVLRSLLFGVRPSDPLTMAAAVGLVIVAIVAAAYFPARRASAIDPSVSLRCD